MCTPADQHACRHKNKPVVTSCMLAFTRHPRHLLSTHPPVAGRHDIAGSHHVRLLRLPRLVGGPRLKGVHAAAHILALSNADHGLQKRRKKEERKEPGHKPNRCACACASPTRRLRVRPCCLLSPSLSAALLPVRPPLLVAAAAAVARHPPSHAPHSGRRWRCPSRFSGSVRCPSWLPRRSLDSA